MHIPVDSLSQQEIEGLTALINGTHTNGLVRIDGKHIILDPFNIDPPKEYEKPLNFPECCNFHKQVFESTKNWFSRFPNCCEPHKILSQNTWFRKSKFNGIENKIVNQLSYTEFHIHENIDSDNWYKNITDYFDYHLASLGQPSIGLEWYIKDLIHFLKYSSKNKNTKEKYKRLIEYLNKWIEVHTRKEDDSTKDNDINLLISTFQKWIDTIPKIDIFSNFKEELNNKIPLEFFLYDSEYNPYLNVTRAKIRTQSELIELLIILTKDVILIINSNYSINNLSKSDLTNREVTILLEKHKLKQINLVGNFTNGEKEYIDVIRKWLKNEKKLFQELKPLIQKKNNLKKIQKI